MALISQRAILACLCFIGFVVVYLLRVNLSVAMVAMVNASTPSSNRSDQVCPPDESVANKSSTVKAGEFDWDEQTQGLILGSFFWGYILTQVPGGILAERFGSKWVLGLGILSTALLTLLTPLAARTSVGMLILLRILEGIGEGVTFPAMNAMLSQWAPPMERAMMSVFIISGSHMGTVIGLPLSGLLCAGDFLGGWPSVFYVFGALGVVWFLFWCVLAYSYPSSHPWISQEELQHIRSSLKSQVSTHSGKGSRPALKVPLYAMLTSPAVLSMFSMHMAYNWLFYMLLTCLPKFLADVLNMPLTEDGFASALPYLILWAAANAAAIFADLARRRSWLSVTALRKICVAFGAIIGATGIAAVGNLGCDRGLAIAILTVSVGLSGVVVSGLGPNQLDLAPPYAGTLLGFSNSLATIPGMVAPVVVGALTNHASTRDNWLKVFYLSAGIVGFGCVSFLTFGSGQVQPWALKSATLEVEEESSVEEEERGAEDTEETNRLLGESGRVQRVDE